MATGGRKESPRLPRVTYQRISKVLKADCLIRAVFVTVIEGSIGQTEGQCCSSHVHRLFDGVFTVTVAITCNPKPVGLYTFFCCALINNLRFYRYFSN